MPKTALELVRRTGAGEHESAQAAQERLLEALPLVSGATAPSNLAKAAARLALGFGIPVPQRWSLPHAGIKEALHTLGVIDCADVRPPQAPLSAAQRRRVREVAQRLSEI